MLTISQDAIDLIVAAEVSSKAYYEKKYRRPEWPGEASGVTVAIGYDLGYATPDKVLRDFGNKLPAGMVQIMASCCGVTRGNARGLLPSVRDSIDVPWDVAIDVFLNRDMPEWIARVVKAIPGADKLSPDSLGAIVSVAYNRGASFNTAGDRYAEMRAVRTHIMSGELSKVPDDIRSMKRLWASGSGLRPRRDAEAALFEKGLRALVPTPTTSPPPVVVKQTLPPLVEPPKAGSAEHGTAGTVVIATTAATQAAHKSGMSRSELAIIFGVGVIAAILLWLAIRAWRSRTITARAKDNP